MRLILNINPENARFVDLKGESINIGAAICEFPAVTRRRAAEQLRNALSIMVQKFISEKFKDGEQAKENATANITGMMLLMDRHRRSGHAVFVEGQGTVFKYLESYALFLNSAITPNTLLTRYSCTIILPEDTDVLIGEIGVAKSGDPKGFAGQIIRREL